MGEWVKNKKRSPIERSRRETNRQTDRQTDDYDDTLLNAARNQKLSLFF